MKKQIIAAIFVSTVMLCGCSTTKFTKYQGTEVFQGAGNKVRTVDGIDLWENEDPNRKYKVLGFIEEIPRHGSSASDQSKLFSDAEDRDAAIAKAAHRRKADAVILVEGPQRPGSEADQGNWSIPRLKKLVIVQYVR